MAELMDLLLIMRKEQFSSWQKNIKKALSIVVPMEYELNKSCIRSDYLQMKVRCV